MESTIKKYEDYLSNGLEKIKPLLLNCFIEYYGEYYRPIIEDKFRNTEFIFYINETRKVPKKRKLNKTSNNCPENFDSLKKDYSQIRKEIKNRTNSTELNRIIYSTIKKEFFSKKFRKLLLLYTNHNLTCENNFSFMNDDYINFVFIPIFFSSDSCLIHEIIHALTSQILLIADDKSIDKTGLNINSNLSTSYLEECITDLEAKEIYKLFFSKYEISFLNSITFSKNIGCSYNLLDNLVFPFLMEYKNIIDYSRLTLNKNKLVYTCGKELYESFEKTVNDCYTEFPKQNEMYVYQDLTKFQVNKMKEYTLSLKR